MLVILATRLGRSTALLLNSLEACGQREVHLDGASCLGVDIAPLLEQEASLRSRGDVHARAFAVGATTGYRTLSGVSRSHADGVLASKVRTRTSSRDSRSFRGSIAASVTTAIGISTLRLSEVNNGLAILDGLQHSSLCATAGNEVKLGICDKVLELLSAVPHHIHVIDVLSGELVGSLCALALERNGEVIQVAKADLLALQKLLTHTIDSHIVDALMSARE